MLYCITILEEAEKRLSITKVISPVTSGKKTNKADYKQYRYH